MIITKMISGPRSFPGGIRAIFVLLFLSTIIAALPAAAQSTAGGAKRGVHKG